ncbi:CTP synthetase [mine drainage metagenome]|uniref:CTP synthase (glutamine hydrolyzing) n=1 Tax=mine drainage metagenome TaxID=410659 RepID=T1AGY8_9ZZZZ
MRTKFVVVTGSLMSGMGKGLITSSILKILDMYGYNVLPVKFDGYLNYDCGTMNPYRHGEVFVLDDKSEVDMDFGMYERFLEKPLFGDLSITGGKLFSGIIKKERKGEYLGEDVQIIPHLTNEIISRIKGIAEKNDLDVMVIEVGGTLGDIENSYFVEAMRQLMLKEKVIFASLTYLPMLDVVGEQKTKPTQIAYRAMMALGIKPTFLFCRTEGELQKKTKSKLSLFTSIDESYIFDDSTQSHLYTIPLHFMEQGFDKILLDELGLHGKISQKKLEKLKALNEAILHPSKEVNIGVVGKYVELRDAYASVKEALVHSGAKLDSRVNIRWIESESLEGSNDGMYLSDLDGIIVPGGFGKRGIEGMIKAITYARESGTPYLGLCLGMQLMSIEYARNVCGMKEANSTEFDPKVQHKVIYTLPSQRRREYKGATMRLGDWSGIIIEKDSIAHKAYKSDIFHERHRHRYEFNNKYMERMMEKGFVISSVTPEDKLVETVEWSGSFGIGTQAHPELKSTPSKPAPLFLEFVRASIEKKYKGKNSD